jgi:hypothetical protein
MSLKRVCEPIYIIEPFEKESEIAWSAVMDAFHNYEKERASSEYGKEGAQQEFNWNMRRFRSVEREGEKAKDH